MYAVIFEVEPYREHRDAYLGLAASLKPHVERIDGFRSVERFQFASHPERLLSLSFWRDEAAIRDHDPAPSGVLDQR